MKIINEALGSGDWRMGFKHEVLDSFNYNFEDIFPMGENSEWENVEMKKNNDSIIVMEAVKPITIFTAEDNYFPSDVHKELVNVIDAMREKAELDFAKDFPDVVREVGKNNVNYSSLTELGYDEEAETLDNYLFETQESMTFVLKAELTNTDIIITAETYFGGNDRDIYGVAIEKGSQKSIRTTDDLERFLIGAIKNIKKIWK